MKTEVIMKRDLSGFSVRQNHKTGMLNANDLMEAGNKARANKGLTEKELFNYFLTDAYKEFENEMLWEYTADEIKKTSRGKNGGTWVHPLVFMDLAMWLSPEFRMKALKWLTDGLLLSRDESGNSFKTMISALKAKYPASLSDARDYKAIANRISSACGVHGTDKWETATEEQLKLRDRIHKNISFFAGERDTLQDCVVTAIRKTLEG